MRCSAADSSCFWSRTPKSYSGIRSARESASMRMADRPPRGRITGELPMSIRPAYVLWTVVGLVITAGAFSYDRHAAERAAPGLAKDLVATTSLSDAERAGAAHRFFLKQRLAPGMTEYPVQKVLEAYQQSLQMPLHSSVAASAQARPASPDQVTQLFWTPLGPGNVGGRTVARVTLRVV